MKICQLTNVGFAVNKFLLPLMNAQLSNGSEVVALCSEDEYVSDLIRAGYRVEIIPISRGMNPIKHIYSIWLIFKFFRKEKFDVVHVHTPVASIVGRIAAWLSNVPLIIYTAHGFYFHDDMKFTKRLFFVFLERFAGYLTSVLFTQSAEDAYTAVSEKIMPKDKVFEIGNGVDINRFNPDSVLVNNTIKSDLGLDESNFVVGMIGRQVQEKGILELLEAAETLIKRYDDISFIIVGDRLDSDHAKGVKNASINPLLLASGRLIFTGMRTDIPQLLQVMDVFTLPSWREGMPRTIIEAMMMELPVVATDIRGSREEVMDNETGFLIPVRNSSALVQALDILYNDRKKSKEMGIAGRNRALELFNEEIVIKKQLDIIKSFLKKNE